MKNIRLLILLQVLGFAFQVQSQIDLPGNSLEEIYHRENPGLKYHFWDSLQVHDYSNNWDLDQDGKMDDIRFIGTNGAHLYYYLEVKISGSGKIWAFPFLELDNPRLAPGGEIPTIMMDNPSFSFPFALVRSTRSDAIGIYLQLDRQTYSANRKELKRRGAKTANVVVCFYPKVKLVDLENWK